MLYLSRVIDGATAGNISLAQAYISDNTAPKDRTKSFALIGIAFGLGFFVGPFLTGYLVRFGLQAPIWAASAMSLTSIVCTITLLPHSGPPQASAPTSDPRPGRQAPRDRELCAPTRNTSQRPVLRGLLAQFFFYMLGFSTFTSGFALFAERRFTWEGHPFTPREIGFLARLRGFPRHHFARWAHRPSREALRRGVARLFGFVSLIIGYRFWAHPRCRSGSFWSPPCRRSATACSAPRSAAWSRRTPGVTSKGSSWV